MSLPASQQRVLDSMENRLRAGEPHLASMFGIFARLNAGEPVSTERLAAGRRWRRPPGTALYAVVIFPLISRAIPPAGSGPAGASCPRAAAPASQYTVLTNGDLALPPSAGASPGPGDTSGMC
jgi:hypothetical protein